MEFFLQDVTNSISKYLVESPWQYAKNVELTMESLILLSILGSPFLPLPEGWLTRRSLRHTYLTIPAGPKPDPEGALFLHSECNPTLHSFFFISTRKWPSILPQMYIRHSWNKESVIRFLLKNWTVILGLAIYDNYS